MLVFSNAFVHIIFVFIKCITVLNKFKYSVSFQFAWHSSVDIPLMGSMNYSNKRNISVIGVQYNFVVHWLNNKEFHMTMEAERIAEELVRRSGDEQDTLSDAGDGGAGSQVTTPAPAVNGIVPVSSEASLTGILAHHTILKYSYG